MCRAPAAIAARLACLALATLGVGVASAQRPQVVGARPLAAARADSFSTVATGQAGGLRTDAWRVDAAPWWAPLASFVVPGAGQAAMRQTRGVAYFAAEAYAWVQAREFRREGNRRRSESRRLAREVARAPFGARRDTSSWSYFEALTEIVESGPFSVTPDGPVTPPTELTSYNGKVWYDARSLYWDPETPLPASDPRYQRALSYYVANAVPEEFRWSWRERQLEWLSYRADIARENRMSRDVTMTLVVIGANHLVSGIDALASLRLRQARGPNGERRFEATMPMPGFGRRPAPRR